MFDVSGSGSCYIVTHNGHPVGPPLWSRTAAFNRAERLDRAAKTRPRPCLRCNSTFPSEGPHNRWCDHCRARPDNGMI